VASEDQYNDKNAAPPTLSKRGATRRRLAKAGVGAAGVLWTLESHATMTPATCKSPSGSLSGGLNSHYGSTAPACNGLSPGYWKNHSGWPCSRTAMFAAIFYVPGSINSCDLSKTATSYLCVTLEDILESKGFDTYNLGMHMAATYLNILSGKIGFLSVDTLKNMWYEVRTTGRYSPAAGVYWTAEEVKKYLEKTQG
jgi:hypothetical protein